MCQEARTDARDSYEFGLIMKFEVGLFKDCVFRSDFDSLVSILVFISVLGVVGPIKLTEKC